jgi:hypothetical protein
LNDPFKEISMPLPVPRSGNPSLNERIFASQPRPAFGEERMTLQGAINKSFLLLVVLLAGLSGPGRSTSPRATLPSSPAR